MSVPREFRHLNAALFSALCNRQRKTSTLTSTELVFISTSGTGACSLSCRNGWNPVHPVRLWLFSSQQDYSVVRLLTGAFVRRSGSGSVRLKLLYCYDRRVKLDQ